MVFSRRFTINVKKNGLLVFGELTKRWLLEMFREEEGRRPSTTDNNHFLSVHLVAIIKVVESYGMFPNKHSIEVK